jgi:PEP-CTERM motif
MMAVRPPRVLAILVALLFCLLGNAAEALILITLDEYGTAVVTNNGVTTIRHGSVIPGGGIAYPWESWGLGGDIISGSLLLIDADGSVSDLITFDNLGPISFYSNGTDDIDSPADRPPPLPPAFGPVVQILETGPEGNNGAFYFAPFEPSVPGTFRNQGFPGNQDALYHFISDGRIPEPASLLLLVSGFVGLAGIEWRRYRQQKDRQREE